MEEKKELKENPTEERGGLVDDIDSIIEKSEKKGDIEPAKKTQIKNIVASSVGGKSDTGPKNKMDSSRDIVMPPASEMVRSPPPPQPPTKKRKPINLQKARDLVQKAVAEGKSLYDIKQVLLSKGYTEEEISDILTRIEIPKDTLQNTFERLEYYEKNPRLPSEELSRKITQVLADKDEAMKPKRTRAKRIAALLIVFTIIIVITIVLLYLLDWIDPMREAIQTFFEDLGLFA
jgi:hypothetical protein